MYARLSLLPIVI